MAFSNIAIVGAATTNETSQSTTNVSVTIASGKLIVVSVACNNISTADGQTSDISVTDAVGNTYTKAGEFTNTVGGAGADGAAAAIFYAIATTGLTAQNISVAFSSAVTAKVIYIHTADRDTAQTMSHAGLQTVANDNANAGSLVISGLTSREYIFWRIVASETDGAGGSDTTLTIGGTGGGTNAAASGTGGSEKGHMSAFVSRAIYSAATGATSSPSMTDTTADMASCFVGLYEVAAATPSYIGGTGMLFLGVGNLGM